jgi:hypothetical protein
MDVVVLIVVTFSSFTSLFYSAFAFDFNAKYVKVWGYEIPYLKWSEHLVFVVFTLDIIFQFMRLPPKDTKRPINWSQNVHLQIAKRYVKSGLFFFDFLVTFPFYMIDAGDVEAVGVEAEKDKNFIANIFGGGNFIYFKMLRLLRIPKLFVMMNISRFKIFIEEISNDMNRRDHLNFKLVAQNFFKVWRLLLMAFVITYCIGCGFYWAVRSLGNTGWDNSESNFIDTFLAD